jgi:hypothetical protein
LTKFWESTKEPQIKGFKLKVGLSSEKTLPNVAASQIILQPEPQEIEQEVKINVSKSEIMSNI